MFTYNELLGQIKQLTPEERLDLIEATAQMLQEDLRYQKSQTLPQARTLKSQTSPKTVNESPGSLNPYGTKTYSSEEPDDLKYS